MKPSRLGAAYNFENFSLFSEKILDFMPFSKYRENESCIMKVDTTEAV